MKAEDWKDKRKAWTKARDATPGVKAGAVKGVSLGEAIEKVYLGWNKGVGPLGKALPKLLDATKKYKTAMAAKPALVKWITDNVEKPAKEVDDALGDDFGTIQGIEIALNVFFERGWQNFVFPDGEEFLKLGIKTPDKDWKNASEPLYFKLRGAIKTWEDFGNHMKTSATGLKLAWPTNTGRTEFLECANAVLHEANLVTELCKTQDQDVNAYLMKAKGCRDTQMMLSIMLNNMKKGVKKLMAD